MKAIGILCYPGPRVNTLLTTFLGVFHDFMNFWGFFWNLGDSIPELLPENSNRVR